MATLETIKSRAEAEGIRMPCRDDVLVWFAGQMASAEKRGSCAWDAVVPAALGDLSLIQNILDEGNRPCYVVEDESRTVALALSYSDLLRHEERR